MNRSESKVGFLTVFTNLELRVTSDYGSIIDINYDLMGWSHEKDEMEIGNARGFLTNVEWAECDFLDVMDELTTEESSEVLNEFFKYNEERELEKDEDEYDREVFFYNSNIATIDRFNILDEHRDIGLGSEALQRIIETLEKIGASYILLKAFPYEIYDDEESEVLPEEHFDKLENLISFYQKNGFKLLYPYERSTDYKAYMYMFTNSGIPFGWDNKTTLR